MPGAAPASRIHPLCYEHHCEMKPHESSSSEDGMDYSCDEPECLVHYSRSDGYFLNTQDQVLIKKAPIPPHQYCSKDRYPMYLLEVQPDQPSFRLWRCPKCSMSRGGGTLI
jgi:hypothetical protein